ECGLSTPRPLAVLFRRKWGLSWEGYLLTEKIPQVHELHRFVAGLNQGKPGLDSPSKRQQTLRSCIDGVARLVRDLHRRQLSHRDLKAANILVTESDVPTVNQEQRGRIWLVDLVGVKRHRRLSRRRRVRNLARLNASFFQVSAITRTDKLRFLRTYLQ